MKLNNSSGLFDKTKITKDNLSTRNQNTLHSKRIHSVSSDVLIFQ